MPALEVHVKSWMSELINTLRELEERLTELENEMKAVKYRLSKYDEW